VEVNFYAFWTLARYKVNDYLHLAADENPGKQSPPGRAGGRMRAHAHTKISKC
jgi:hypothetical protein